MHALISINTSRPKQNGRHFPDDIFKCIFLNETIWNLIEISLYFVPRGPINNIPALLQIMAWRRPGGKPLSEPMVVIVYLCIYASLGINELNHVYFVEVGQECRNITYHQFCAIEICYNTRGICFRDLFRGNWFIQAGKIQNFKINSTQQLHCYCSSRYDQSTTPRCPIQKISYIIE